jgi:uncharacterized SAM-binding protein YcdF (DUF218 family)
METKSRLKPWRRISCLLGILLIPILAALLFTAMGGVLVVADPLEKVDAIVMLSGGGEERINETIRLYQEEYAQTIILTETGAILKGYNAEYSKEQRLIFLDAEIPSTSIWISPHHAASTRDEAKDVRALVNNKDVYSLIVVTDPYHTLRTRMIWNEVFANSGIKIIVRPARESWYKSSTWWLSAEGWRNTLNEYVKIASYIILRKAD